MGLVGARQVGKSTLARTVTRSWKGPVEFFDLEDPKDLARLRDPMLVLRGLRGLIVIDEVQRLPGVFESLRVLADRPRKPARFLVLGSASPDLLRQSSETLAGRISYHELGGLSLDEIGVEKRDRLWLRGGLPRSYLARNLKASEEWRSDFIRTFLERDLPELGIGIASTTLRRFWTMLAHWHGQLWNASELARAFGVADTTVRGYLDHLTSALVVRQLPPWYENISRRQVKAPKIYLADSGLLHTLLGLRTRADVDAHPKLGASWEGFVLGQLVRRLGARPEECYFWAAHTGAELDLLVLRGRRRFGFEIKRTVAPSPTRSMWSAHEVLRLDHLYLVHAGEHTFPLREDATALAFSRLFDDLKPLP